MYRAAVTMGHLITSETRKRLEKLLDVWVLFLWNDHQVQKSQRSRTIQNYCFNLFYSPFIHTLITWADLLWIPSACPKSGDPLPPTFGRLWLRTAPQSWRKAPASHHLGMTTSNRLQLGYLEANDISGWFMMICDSWLASCCIWILSNSKPVLHTIKCDSFPNMNDHLWSFEVVINSVSLNYTPIKGTRRIGIGRFESNGWARLGLTHWQKTSILFRLVFLGKGCQHVQQPKTEDRKLATKRWQLLKALVLCFYRCTDQEELPHRRPGDFLIFGLWDPKYRTAESKWWFVATFLCSSRWTKHHEA